LRPTAGTGGSSTITWSSPPRDREFLFVVGAAKAGTTSLHAYLDAHAGVHMSDPKEPHFFARAINPSVRTKSWDTYAEAFRGATENAILGDASTSYLWDPAGADLIHEALPDSRIVVLLRDPVARAISHYKMDVRNGRQRRSFDDALRADAAIRERIWGVKSHLYIDLSMYAAQVRRYLDTFGRDRVLILESATLRKSRSAALTQIARFLGIDPSGFDEARVGAEYNLTAMPRSIQLNYVATRRPMRRVSKILPAGVRSAIRRGLSSAEPRIGLETRRRLQDHFAPDVDALRDLTGLPLRSLTSNWR
jgi:sulfotransferase family protein